MDVIGRDEIAEIAVKVDFVHIVTENGDTIFFVGYSNSCDLVTLLDKFSVLSSQRYFLFNVKDSFIPHQISTI